MTLDYYIYVDKRFILHFTSKDGACSMRHSSPYEDKTGKRTVYSLALRTRKNVSLQWVEYSSKGVLPTVSSDFLQIYIAKVFKNKMKVMYQSIPKPPIPPRAIPGHLTHVKLRTAGNLTLKEAHPVRHLTFV